MFWFENIYANWNNFDTKILRLNKNMYFTCKINTNGKQWKISVDLKMHSHLKNYAHQKYSWCLQKIC